MIKHQSCYNETNLFIIYPTIINVNERYDGSRMERDSRIAIT